MISFLMRDVGECPNILAALLNMLQLRAFDRHHTQNHPLHLFNLFYFTQLGIHPINTLLTFICLFTSLLTASFRRIELVDFPYSRNVRY